MRVGCTKWKSSNGKGIQSREGVGWVVWGGGWGLSEDLFSF